MASEEELQPWIDDALKQIEFVCGPADSEWGAKRAELGYEEPFALHYVEVGNEDWLAGGPEGWAAYQEYRLPMFMEAILAKYPEMNVISSGSTYDVGGYDIPEPAIGDYHPYREPDEFLEEFNLFDNNTTVSNLLHPPSYLEKLTPYRSPTLLVRLSSHSVIW